MTITAIKRQVKRSHRFSVFVDGKYTFSLDEQQIISADVRIDQEVDNKQLQAFRLLSQQGITYEKVLRYIAIRRRSKKEIIDYLHRKGVGEKESSATIQRLETAGYIDDEQFAISWVAARRKHKHASRTRIVYELRAKGVEAKIIQRAIESDEIDEGEALRALIEKKRRIVRYQDDQKLLEYLVRQGYSYGAIKTLLNDEA